MKLVKRYFIILMSLKVMMVQGAFISSGQVHNCVWDGRDGSVASCWGYNGKGQLNSPPLRSVRSMGSGAWHNCVLHESVNREPLIECWGNSIFNQTTVPRMSGQPVSLSVGRWHSCGLWRDENHSLTLKCWGKEDYQQTKNHPDIEAPTAVFAGNDFTCARIRDERIRCWGKVDASYGPEEQPGVTGDEGFSCRERSPSQVECWNNRASERFVRRVNKRFDCQLRNGILTCNDEHVLGNLPGIRDFSLGDWHICAMNDTRAKCWGDNNSEGQLDVPDSKIQFGPILLGWESTPVFFDVLSQWVYQFDREFIAHLSTTSRGLGKEATVFLLNLARPYLASLGYKHLRDAYLHSALEEIDRLTHNLYPQPLVGVATLRAFGDEHRTLAVRALVSLLTSANRLLTQGDRKLVQKIVAELGQALISGGDPDPVSMERIFNRFINSPYLSSRADSGRLIVAYLISPE